MIVGRDECRTAVTNDTGDQGVQWADRCARLLQFRPDECRLCRAVGGQFERFKPVEIAPCLFDPIGAVEPCRAGERLVEDNCRRELREVAVLVEIVTDGLVAV